MRFLFVLYVGACAGVGAAVLAAEMPDYPLPDRDNETVSEPLTGNPPETYELRQPAWPLSEADCEEMLAELPLF